MGTAASPRGTSNSNKRGSTLTRRRRREWLVETFRANVDIIRIYWPSTNEWTEAEWSEGLEQLADRSERVPACRCYRCGKLLTADTVTVDRIIPECKGGTYRRNNIRPACLKCNSETGGALANGKEHQAAKKRAKSKRTIISEITETVTVYEGAG